MGLGEFKGWCVHFCIYAANSKVHGAPRILGCTSRYRLMEIYLKQLGAWPRSFELTGELEKGWLIAEAADEMLSERLRSGRHIR
ncbi:hypothetical protein [Ensifer adhaerens]|nr:hypothetical protein [Ensifer adhaerens]